ncbi:MAG: UPF0175 family protein [archaeon]
MNKTKKVLEKYQKGQISLGKAAKTAGLTVSETMDLLADLGIKSNVSQDYHLQGLKNLRKVW